MLFPDFWLKPKFPQSTLPYLLYPISMIWMTLVRLQQMIVSPSQSQIPIICIGNLTIGGNGKTPTAIKLRSLLQDMGYKPHILSRGYKAAKKGPHLVNPLIDSSTSVGDEALMMASYGPTWISRSRRAGITAATASGANIIIMDDGFQNQSIRKDFSVLVIETSVGFGNGYVIPAGPLRETVSSGLAKANIIITIGEKIHQKNFEKEFLFVNSVPTIKGRLVPKTPSINLQNKSVIGFAGIAHPQKFRATLENMGANIIKFTAFTNHKPFKKIQLQKLVDEAEKNQAILVTTEKDFVRIPKNLQHNFQNLKVVLDIQNQDLLLKKLIPILGSHQFNSSSSLAFKSS